MERARAFTPPLYATEREIAEQVFGVGKTALTEWQTLAVILRREGLPDPDPITKRRYWPAVRDFLDRRAGLGDSHSPYQRPDGRENFDEDRRRTRARG